MEARHASLGRRTLEDIRQKRTAERLSKTSSGSDLAKPPTGLISDGVGIGKSESATRLTENDITGLVSQLQDMQLRNAELEEAHKNLSSTLQNKEVENEMLQKRLSDLGHMDSITSQGSPVPCNFSRRKGKSVAPSAAAKWTDANTATLIEACVKEVRSGSRPAGKFDHSSWMRVVEHFNCETGSDYTKLQLKNRLDSLKRMWTHWTALNRGETGLGWDSIRQTVSAEPGWWARKIQENPEVAKFRTKGPLLKELQAEIFEGVVATGSWSWAPSSGNRPRREQMGEGSAETDPDASANPVAENDATPLDSDEGPRVTPPAKSSLIAKKQKKLRSAESIAKSLDTMAEAQRLRAEAKNSRPSYTISECMAALEAIPEISLGSPLWFFATHLFADATQRELFLVISTDDLRLVWLQAKWSWHKVEKPAYYQGGNPFP